MPIYEYRCPDGHTFELLQRMSDPPPEECQICGAAPVTKVLYPAAVHFKGSGFYSTEYGRGGRKRNGSKDGDSSSGEATKSGEKSETKDAKKSEKSPDSKSSDSGS